MEGQKEAARDAGEEAESLRKARRRKSSPGRAAS